MLSTSKVVKIFICYSSKDERLKNELLAHLSPWMRQGIIESWDNRQIKAGDEQNKEILEHINKADIVLCLLSSDFLNSEYYDTLEMKRAWERQECGEIEIIPVLLREVDWQRTPFRRLQVIPRNGKSIKHRFNKDKVFVEIAQELEIVFEEVKAKKESRI